MLKKLIINVLLITIILGVLCTPICYAQTVAVTDTNLNTALQKLAGSEYNEANYSITAANNVITISSGSTNHKINYNLTNNPTFSFDLNILKGMTYDQFTDMTEYLILPMIGYIAVTDIQGVETEDIIDYLTMYLLQFMFSSFLTNTPYVIIDDDDTTTVAEEGQILIKESEFGNYVVEYANAVYGNGVTISDATGYNTFTWTMKAQDKTDTSCKLVSTVTVILDADFSELRNSDEELPDDDTLATPDADASKDEAEENDTPVLTEEETPTEPAVPTVTEERKQTETPTQAESSNTPDAKLPQTGTNETILIILGIALGIMAVIFGIKNLKYRDIH